MKELTIEEKAQKYDEAIEKAKEFKNNSFAGYDGTDYDGADLLSSLFPELIENRDELEDEKIRKALIDYFSDFNLQTFAGLDPKKILAWLEKQGEPTNINPSEFDLRLNKLLKQFETLPKKELVNCLSFYLNVVQNDGTYREEKQGEQKPVDKAEPKFKAGDWVVCNNGPHHIFQVIERSWPNAKYRNINGIEILLNVNTLDKQYHLWTIQDAKDGDVLASEDKDKIFIYNGKLDLRGRVCGYCGIYKTHAGLRFTRCAIGNYFTYKEPYPATKEQRDLLFQKMKEAGYEWDSEKKELKKIEQKSIEWEPQTGDTFRKKGTTSPTYHLCNKREDGITFGFVENREVGIAGGEITIFSLKDNYELVKRPKSIEEELNKDWQTKVKQISAWSEEDEEMFDAIIADIQFTQKAHNHEVNQVVYEREIDWLKSIKERCTWKPSEEQIKALSAINVTGRISYVGQGQELINLYNDLKKLKEE